MTPHLRKEIMKADVYKARLKFLQENNITTADDLTACLQQAENEVTQLAKQRTILNVRKKKHKKLFDALAAEAAFAGFEPRKAEYDDAKEVLDTLRHSTRSLAGRKADLYEQLAQVNQQIRQERWKLKQCKEISETAVIMQKDIDRVEQQPQRVSDTGSGKARCADVCGFTGRPRIRAGLYHTNALSALRAAQKKGLASPALALQIERRR